MPTRRQERVNNRIVQEVSEVVRELKDPRIGFVTITRAEVSPDLRHADVFFSVLGDETTAQETTEGIQHSARHIQRDIGPRLGLKYTPELHFKYDMNIQYADRMSRLIQEARDSDPNLVDPDGEADPDGEDGPTVLE